MHTASHNNLKIKDHYNYYLRSLTFFMFCNFLFILSNSRLLLNLTEWAWFHKYIHTLPQSNYIKDICSSFSSSSTVKEITIEIICVCEHMLFFLLLHSLLFLTINFFPNLNTILILIFNLIVGYQAVFFAKSRTEQMSSINCADYRSSTTPAGVI